MHSLETIIQMNSPKEVAKARAYARALNGAKPPPRNKLTAAQRRNANTRALMQSIFKKGGVS